MQAHRYLNLPAPAKLNLFLHLMGRRADGYHELQSVFVAIGLSDTLDFTCRSDGQLERSGELIGPLEGDLALRAARALQTASACPLGAHIHVEKRIPAGSGLGGGSSDAATTLIALNRLWGLNWPREKLASIGLTLGADVPFFLGASPALVEGIGERLRALPNDLAGPALWAIVVYPQVHLSTAAVFTSVGLTYQPKLETIRALSEVFCPADNPLCEPGLIGHNALQAAAVSQAPEIGAALKALDQTLGRPGAARMTGSGSAVFALTSQEARAKEAAEQLAQRSGFSCWAAKLLSEHPLSEW